MLTEYAPFFKDLRSEPRLALTFLDYAYGASKSADTRTIAVYTLTAVNAKKLAPSV